MKKAISLKSSIMTPNGVLQHFEDALKNCSKTGGSFKNYFGDLSKMIFQGSLDLSSLNLTSLEGCPTEVVGEFNIRNNPELKSLKHFPKLNGNRPLHINTHHFKELRRLDNDLWSQISHIKYIGDPIPNIDIVTTMLHFKLLGGNFPIKRVGHPLQENEELEKLFNIYKKVGFQEIKFRRAVSLL